MDIEFEMIYLDPSLFWPVIQDPGPGDLWSRDLGPRDPGTQYPRDTDLGTWTRGAGPRGPGIWGLQTGLVASGLQEI